MSASTQNNTPARAKDQPYKRGYVACMGCRARKVRCMLGNKPPCAKCLREHRECVFQTNRKSRKQREPPKWTRAQGNSRVPSGQDGRVENDRGPSEDISADIQGRDPSPDRSGVDQHAIESPPSNGSPLANRVMSTILARPSDALDVLFDAAQPENSPPGRSQETQGNSTNSSTVSESGLVEVSGLSQPSDEILDLWDKSRFVRQGWFTAQEAVTYLDLFYQYLAPLSPVLTDEYRDHRNHERLVTEEPLLCCTLLTISSRFFVLPSAGGVSRSHFIHHRLWQYCELLVRRIMFGQEKYSTAKTRVMGSIESLILISDWNPRSVHFPPDSEGWDSELISPAYDRRNRLQKDSDMPLIRWREDVFEPAKRAERLSWMLLGAAVNLGYELGVFTDNIIGPESAIPHYSDRASRARKLLYIYVTQMAVRMGCSSLLPDSATFMAPASSQHPIEPVHSQWESYMGLWMDLTRLMKTASSMFFQSRSYIQQQLVSGHYRILLQHFGPSLAKWHEEFTSLSPNLPDGLQPLILIEYYHLKTYTNALSIQAVVERASAQGIGLVNNPNGAGLETCMLPHDYKFIRDVISDSGEVLELAITMSSRGRLRYAPLRALLCITSSSIFLLKALSLGARNADLQTSLHTLDRCIAALRSSGTDDMDFSLRYATLIEKHVARFRSNFVLPLFPDHSMGVVPDRLPPPPPPPPAGLEAHSSNIRNIGDPVAAAPPHPMGTDRTNGDRSFNVFDPSRIPSEDDWWARPFDPNIAPFGSSGEDISFGLEPDSLDFLWNLPGVGGE